MIEKSYFYNVFVRRVERWVKIEPGEGWALFWSFSYFFALLCSYYIIRPLRDEMGVEVVERPIDRTEIYLAEEAFFCGTGVQIAAITSVDYRPIGTGQLGPITRELRRIYFDIVRGNVPKYREFCAPVYQRAESLKKS